MDKDIFIYNEILCDNMDGPRCYYVKWKKKCQIKINNVWFYLYVESKNKTNILTEIKRMVTQEGV